MRIDEKEIETLKRATLSFDENAELFLFGSRVDDEKRGGDIDILILSDQLKRENLRQIRGAFFDRFGEQKVDIVLDKLDPIETFTQMIYKKAVRL